ncbi:MAG: patatin family protein [Paludibacteraceae bacterium]|nr:patatin family protein [Paludibacteraceae bacterium]
MKNGLVLEGGGLRGLFSSGVMDVMMENGIKPDGIIGVSAGATFGCNYKSNQPGRALRYNIDFKDDPRFMGFRTLLKTGDLVSNEFSYHILPRELDVFDNETYTNNPMEFYVVCTNVETGEAVYKKIDTMDDHNLDWLRASASLPALSRPVKIDGYTLLDGGMADSIPLAYFQGKGYERNIVILTQPLGFRKKKPSIMPIMKFLLRKTPVVADALAKRHIMYNKELDYIAEQAKIGNTMLIYPDIELPIGRIEMNADKMRNVYNMGRKVGEEKLNAIKAFYNLG